jgi:hypothetical protein
VKIEKDLWLLGMHASFIQTRALPVGYYWDHKAYIEVGLKQKVLGGSITYLTCQWIQAQKYCLPETNQGQRYASHAAIIPDIGRAIFHSL